MTICTLTRDKASRRVRKFKTSRSTASLDKIDKNRSDSNSRSSESDSNFGSSTEHIKDSKKSTSPITATKEPENANEENSSIPEQKATEVVEPELQSTSTESN